MNFDEIVAKINPDVNYTVNQIKEMLGVSQHAILSSIKRGRFEGRKIFGKWYIKGIDVINYLSKGSPTL